MKPATEEKNNKMKRKLKLEDVQKVNEGTYECLAISAFNRSIIRRPFVLKVKRKYFMECIHPLGALGTSGGSTVDEQGAIPQNWKNIKK